MLAFVLVLGSFGVSALFESPFFPAGSASRFRVGLETF